MFIELWQGLRDLYHDNKQTESENNAKRFINWAIRDLANEYDWEFLRATTSLTPSADGEYNLNPITQLSSLSANIYAIAALSADNGVSVYMGGKKLSEAVSSNPTLTIDSDTFTISAGVSASASGYSQLDWFYKQATNGAVYITNGTAVIATLGASDTYVSNNIRRISQIVDPTGNNCLYYIDYATELKGNPSSSAISAYTGYDFNGAGNIRIFNAQNVALTILYQKLPKYLINNYDRTEFPYEMYQDIIDFAYRVYGKRFQDEADAIQDMGVSALKHMLAGEIIRKWSPQKKQRVVPRGLRRAV